jgi:hypothetical protein
LARFEFTIKPSAALLAISSGIPDSHFQFWRLISVEAFHSVYIALSATPQKVLAMLREPTFFREPAQERVFSYLCQFIENLETSELQKFLWFVTGSTVCTSSGGIEVAFNSLTRIARRPVALAC